MKLVMTLLVRDEIDIVGANIEYHLAHGVDQVVAIDNGSVDGTRDLLADYARQGQLIVIDEPEQNYNQSAWMTNAAQFARDSLGAEWVLSNDADEFWVSPTGNLTDQLAGDAPDVLRCTRRNMVFAWDDEHPEIHWAERCRFRKVTPIAFKPPENPHMDGLSCPYFFLRLRPKVLTRTYGLVSMAQGNHDATFSRPVTKEESDILIYHFPVRTRGQFETKVRNGGSSYAANPDFPIAVGWHWRRWHRMMETHGIEKALADALPDAESLAHGVSDDTVAIDDTMLSTLGDHNLVDRIDEPAVVETVAFSRMCKH